MDSKKGGQSGVGAPPSTAVPRRLGKRPTSVAPLRAPSNHEPGASLTAFPLTGFWDVDIVAVRNNMLLHFQHKSGCIYDNAPRPQRTNDAKTDAIEGVTSLCGR